MVTAAHCVKGISADSLKVVYGSHNVNEYDEDLVFEVVATDWHENYDYPSFSNEELPLKAPWPSDYDIGVVLLKGPIQHAVTAEIYDGKLPIGMIAILAGYGRDEEGVSGVLNWGAVPVREVTEKEVIFGKNYPNGNDKEIGSDPDACYGDSGGPAYTTDLELITTTSRLPLEAPVITCGYGYIGTRVGPFKGWLEDKYQELREEHSSEPVKYKNSFEEDEDLVVLDRGCSVSGSGKSNNGFIFPLAALFGLAYRRRED